jgi:hypothetical protein
MHRLEFLYIPVGCSHCPQFYKIQPRPFTNFAWSDDFECPQTNLGSAGFLSSGPTMRRFFGDLICFAVKQRLRVPFFGTSARLVFKFSDCPIKIVSRLRLCRASRGGFLSVAFHMFRPALIAFPIDKTVQNWCRASQANGKAGKHAHRRHRPPFSSRNGLARRHGFRAHGPFRQFALEYLGMYVSGAWVPAPNNVAEKQHAN